MKARTRESRRPALVSREGYERLYWRLQYLIRVSRQESAKDLEQAASFGPGPRNPELRSARESRHWVEWSIEKLVEEMEACQVIISPPPADGRVHFGSLVRLMNRRRKIEELYRIVGRAESDPRAGRLSLESPVGRAIMGKSVGTVVEVETPAGPESYLIRGIE